MGEGKTLSAVFLAVLNYAKHHKRIYSNIDLGIPHYRIGSMAQIDAMTGIDEKTGESVGAFCILDEIMKYADSRRSSSNTNKLITMILSASRKRNIDICYTAQYFKSMDIRIRAVTDLHAVPTINDAGVCSLEIFDSDFRTFIERKRFPAQAIFPLYNTREEVNDLIV